MDRYQGSAKGFRPDNRVARSSLARHRRAEQALVKSLALPQESSETRPRTKRQTQIPGRQLIAVTLVALSLILVPVTCGAMPGPHSLFQMPPSVPAPAPAIGHRHHHETIMKAPSVVQIVPIGPRFGDLSEMEQVVSELTAVILAIKKDAWDLVYATQRRSGGQVLSGRAVGVDPPPPRR